MPWKGLGWAEIYDIFPFLESTLKPHYYKQGMKTRELKCMYALNCGQWSQGRDENGKLTTQF